MLFNLWSFYKTSENTCEFDVTLSNMPGFNKGTAQWVQLALKAFGLSVRVVSWKVVPLRSFYYTDYPDADEAWQDRWPDAWLIRVVFEGNLDDLNEFTATPLHFDESDTSWEYEHADPGHDSAALIVCDLMGSRHQVDELNRRLSGRIAANAQTMVQESSIRSFSTSKRQLRIMLSAQFPDDVPFLEELLEVCTDAGGAVGWRLSDL